jgi:hypothetical protein
MGYIAKKSSSQAKFVELFSYTEVNLAINSVRDAIHVTEKNLVCLKRSRWKRSY